VLLKRELKDEESSQNKTDGKRYFIDGGYNTLYGYNTLNRAYTTILDNPVTLVNAPLTTLIQSPSYVYAKRSDDDDGSVSESSNENTQSDKSDDKRAVFFDYYQPMTLLGGSQVTLLDGYQRSYLIGKRGSQKDEHNVHDGLATHMETGAESQEETSSVRPRDISSMNGQRNEKTKSRPSQSMPMNSGKNNNQKHNDNAPGKNQRNN